jgi:hypothetical protein
MSTTPARPACRAACLAFAAPAPRGSSRGAVDVVAGRDDGASEAPAAPAAAARAAARAAPLRGLGSEGPVPSSTSSFSFSSSSSPFASSPFASFPSEGSSASARLDETFARVEAFAPPEKVRRVAAAPPSFPSEPPRVPSAPAAVPVPYPFGELVENDREPAPHVPCSVVVVVVVVSSRPIGVASFRLSLGAFDILQKRARLSFGGFAFFTQRLRHERQREETAFFLRGFLAILNRSKRLGFRACQTPALGDGVRQRTRGRFVVFVVFVRSLRLRRLVALVVAASPAADPDLALELLADPELLGDGLLRARQVRQALADRALRPAARVLVLQEHAFLRAQVLASAFGGIFTLQPLEGGVVVAVAVDHHAVAVDQLHRARLAVVPVERLAFDRLDPFRLELVPKKQVAHLRQTRAALARLLRAQSVQRQVLRFFDVSPADQAALLDLRHDGFFEIRRAVSSGVESGVHGR